MQKYSYKGKMHKIFLRKKCKNKNILWAKMQKLKYSRGNMQNKNILKGKNSKNIFFKFFS
jgi:hypothetical protein